MTGNMKDDSCSSSPRVDKGHFVVYTVDRRCFMIPLVYLHNHIFRELLGVAEEEFGLPRDGPIMLSCDGIFMEYALLLIQRKAADL
ncbi:hypothetical protein Nepgr_004767 [Nepenthes gracilis]|uniref:Uncharacterized protein n=1 Tax=Nepenthes gracilis TaxID=150966 RepID=A0AAD3S1W4_NEPGR|nr:hypothetical protein Nepgr_004767 [Nepenthes gracilis]